MSDWPNEGWIPTTGGPYLLVPEEFLAAWRGVEGWNANGDDPEDQSDYARICRISKVTEPIQCGGGVALGLDRDAGGDIRWIEGNEFRNGIFIHWITEGDNNDDEVAISAAYSSGAREALLAETAEVIEFSTGASGVMWLIDSTQCGSDEEDEISPRATFKWSPGRFEVRSAFYEMADDFFILRQPTYIGPDTQ